MSRNALSALACAFAAFVWSGGATANPADHPVEHPAPEGDHHKDGEHKDDGHKDGEHKDDTHKEGEQPKGH